MSITTRSSTVIYTNPWLSLREDEIEYADGSRSIYSVVDKPDFAIVIPYENGGFHLVEQYRYPIRERAWEFPAGSFPPGATGTPEQMAAAELLEETGLTAGRMEHLGRVYPTNGLSTEGFHAYLATDLAAGEHRRERSEQDMRQRWFPRADVEAMMRDGELTDGPSMAAYLLLRLRAG